MKKIILRLTILVFMMAIGFVIYLSQSISDKDIFYYKSFKFCSSLIKDKMKLPSSYEVDKVYVVYKVQDDIQLKDYISGKDYLQDDYKNNRLDLYGFYTFIKYQAKNGYGVELKSDASCDFNVLSFKEGGFFSPTLVSVNFGNHEYKNSDIFLTFSGFTNIYRINKINLLDKFDYFFHKSIMKISNK